MGQAQDVSQIFESVKELGEIKVHRDDSGIERVVEARLL
jgi:hypothetical protein